MTEHNFSHLTMRQPNPSFPLSPHLKHALIGVGLLSLLVRIWIGATLPITGDEAYFYWWGVFPDWGYYDHPPMAGWWVAAMLQLFGDSTLSIRWPAMVLPLALGATMWWAFSPIDREKTAWAVLLFWLAPLNWLNSLITTDTPLIFWSLLSVACMVRAELRAAQDRQALTLHGLSGLFLACAFLSKYFAVVIGFSYMLYFAIYRRERWLGFLLMVLAALPGPAINLWWNMGHGWANIMFNVYNRNQGEAFSWDKPALYALTWFYLLTPGTVWLVWRERAALGHTLTRWPLLATLVVFPLAFFALLSVKKIVGLHWVLNFYPLFFVLLALALPMVQVRRCAYAMSAFLALHLVALVVMYSSQLSDWKNLGMYPQIVRSYRTQALLDKLQAPDTVLMTTAYTPSATFGQTLKRYVPVFGEGDFHARQDDLWLNFADYDQQTLRVVTFQKPDLTAYAPFFDAVSEFSAEQDGITVYGVQGQRFHYAAYHDIVLKRVFEQRYQIPSWLPMTGCHFCVNYCGRVRCGG
jgi:hypothetical protein